MNTQKPLQEKGFSTLGQSSVIKMEHENRWVLGSLTAWWRSRCPGLVWNTAGGRRGAAVREPPAEDTAADLSPEGTLWRASTSVQGWDRHGPGGQRQCAVLPSQDWSTHLLGKLQQPLDSTEDRMEAIAWASQHSQYHFLPDLPALPALLPYFRHLRKTLDYQWQQWGKKRKKNTTTVIKLIFNAPFSRRIFGVTNQTSRCQGFFSYTLLFDILLTTKIRENTHWSFGDWLVLLIIIPSDCIQSVLKNRISSFFMAE